jgi:galactose mutarotase-like enzyme
MALYTLTKGPLRLEVSSKGGSIEGFWRQDTPLLRSGKKSGIATESSCFPLVPFGNRVSGNRFSWKDREYELAPNVAWDKHYLHGDGWLEEWSCESRREESLLLTYKHAAGAYRYQATQLFRLTEDALTVTLTVTNEGRHSLPFGLGWHPYFPLAPETRLQAGASGYWKEREAWLAGEFSAQLPEALDFAQPSLVLPRCAVNLVIITHRIPFFIQYHRHIQRLEQFEERCQGNVVRVVFKIRHRGLLNAYFFGQLALGPVIFLAD